jgi:hypothetical protein
MIFSRLAWPLCDGQAYKYEDVFLQNDFHWTMSTRALSASIPRLSHSEGRGVFSADSRDARWAFSYEKPRLSRSAGRGYFEKTHGRTISFFGAGRGALVGNLKLL